MSYQTRGIPHQREDSFARWFESFPEWVLTGDLCRALGITSRIAYRYGNIGHFRRRRVAQDDPRHKAGPFLYEWHLLDCRDALRGYLYNRHGVTLDPAMVWSLARGGFHTKDMAKIMKMPARSIVYRLRQAGYEFEHCSRLTKAPCLGCERALPTGDLNFRGYCTRCVD